MTCASVLTTAESPGSKLISDPCTLPAGHHGRCRNADGRKEWTRLGEILRGRGQIVDGPRLRRVAS